MTCLKLETGVDDVGVRGVSHVSISTIISSRYCNDATVESQQKHATDNANFARHDLSIHANPNANGCQFSIAVTH